MSAICAIVDRGGAPALDDVGIMVRAGSHRGPDGHAMWHDQLTAMGINAFRTLPTDPVDATVHVSCDGRYRAVMDGRIDNLSELDGAARASRGAADVSYVVDHISRRGPMGFADVIGDFAVVIWDTVGLRLIAACDPMAGRPLFVSTNTERVAFASEVRQLTALPWVSTEMDQGSVAEWLTGDPRTLGATLFASIRRLRPGHVTVIDGRSRRSTDTAFWRLDPGYDRRSGSDIHDDMRHRLSAAVSCRMRAVGTVGIEVSGGLDSSSILGVAAALAPAGTRTMAFTNGYSAIDADERSYARAAAQHSGISLCEVDDADVDLDARADAAFSMDFPGPPDAGDTLRLGAAAAQNNVRVMLTGQGGDQILGGTPGAALDHLSHGHIGRAFAIAWQNGHGNPAMRLLRGGYWSMAEPLRAWVQPSSLGTAARKSQFDWLTDDFVRDSALLDRLADAEPTARRRRPWDGMRVEMVSSGSVVPQWDVLTRLYNRVPVDPRHPFMDRRVVELAASVPPRLTYRGDDWRIFHRSVVRGSVPEQIRCRTDKAEFSHIALRYLARLGGRDFFATCEPVMRGWVDRDEICRRYDAFSVATTRPPFGASLIATASMHHWLGALAAADADRKVSRV